jgi:intraflagellar transport protein 74
LLWVQDLDESQSERHQKYRELRRREETMEQFLSTFDDSRDQEMTRIGQLESSIVTALQQMSHNLAHSGHLPSVDDFAAMRDTLSFKEGELEKSRKTVEGLGKEQQQLRQNLQKVRPRTCQFILCVHKIENNYSTNIFSGCINTGNIQGTKLF